MYNIGDILICKKEHQQFGNINIVGKKYTILNITDNGNIYISTDLMCGSFTLYVNRLRSGKQIDDSYVVIDGAGCSTAYSYLPDSVYSRLYIVDYFTLLSESRNIKLEEILI